MELFAEELAESVAYATQAAAATAAKAASQQQQQQHPVVNTDVHDDMGLPEALCIPNLAPLNPTEQPAAGNELNNLAGQYVNAHLSLITTTGAESPNVVVMRGREVIRLLST